MTQVEYNEAIAAAEAVVHGEGNEFYRRVTIWRMLLDMPSLASATSLDQARAHAERDMVEQMDKYVQASDTLVALRAVVPDPVP